MRKTISVLIFTLSLLLFPSHRRPDTFAMNFGEWLRITPRPFERGSASAAVDPDPDGEAAEEKSAEEEGEAINKEYESDRALNGSAEDEASTEIVTIVGTFDIEEKR